MKVIAAMATFVFNVISLDFEIRIVPTPHEAEISNDEQ